MGMNVGSNLAVKRDWPLSSFGLAYGIVLLLGLRCVSDAASPLLLRWASQ